MCICITSSLRLVLVHPFQAAFVFAGTAAESWQLHSERLWPSHLDELERDRSLCKLFTSCSQQTSTCRHLREEIMPMRWLQQKFQVFYGPERNKCECPERNRNATDYAGVIVQTQCHFHTLISSPSTKDGRNSVMSPTGLRRVDLKLPPLSWQCLTLSNSRLIQKWRSRRRGMFRANTHSSHVVNYAQL